MSNVLTYNRYDFHSMCIRPVRDKNYHKTSGQKKTYLVKDTKTNHTIKEEEVTFFDDYIQIEEDKYKFKEEMTVKDDGLNFLVDFYDGELVDGMFLLYKYSYGFTKNRSLGFKTTYVVMGDKVQETTHILILK